ncbi:omptin family outer membrane protease [Arcobacteraceae bacterium]|nr:omptin family outer membrane protease [Arcobacteraceae bacterium]
MSLTSIDSISHEFVYNPSNQDEKLSELIWEADDVSLLGLQFDYLLSRKSFLQVDYKINITDGNSMMADYDWLKTGNPNWSDRSTHPNTKLDKLTIFDISINNKIEDTSEMNTNVVIGYKVEHKSFKAYDGSYIYSSSGGFRDLEGTFSGLGISYEESFKSIYLGLDISRVYKEWLFNLNLTYSPKVTVTNKDTHHNRYFINNNTFSNTTMTGIDTSISYLVSQNISLALNYLQVKYDEVKGTTTRTYYTGATEQTPGSVFTYGGAGISNSYSFFGLVLVAKF